MSAPLGFVKSASGGAPEALTFAEVDARIAGAIGDWRARLSSEAPVRASLDALFLTVEATEVESVALHVLRCAQAETAARAVFASSATTDSPWAAIGAALSASVGGASSSRPELGGGEIANRIGGASACIVVAESKPTSLGRATLEALAALNQDAARPAAAAAALLVVVSAQPQSLDAEPGQVFIRSPLHAAVARELRASDVGAWWRRASTAPLPIGQQPSVSLPDLEAWWATALSQQTPNGARKLPALSNGAERLLARLVAFGGAVEAAALTGGALELGRAELEAIEAELEQSGLVERVGGALSVRPIVALFCDEIRSRTDAGDRAVVAGQLRELAGSIQRSSGASRRSLVEVSLRVLELGVSTALAEDEHEALRAIRGVVAADAREDAWVRFDALFSARWAAKLDGSRRTSLAPSSGEGVASRTRVSVLVHATDVALSVGDSERAIQFAQRARRECLVAEADDAEMSVCGSDEPDVESEAIEAEVLLHLGRAEVATGDLSAANLSIQRAIALADQHCVPHVGRWARVEHSEILYTLGRLDEARSLAESASESKAPRVAASHVPASHVPASHVPASHVPASHVRASGVAASGVAPSRVAPSRVATSNGLLARAGATRSLRLGARNVLGKVLLARANFVEAEQHFAADAADAACLGDTVSELRARLNRAIALMSLSRYSEARAMLEVVQHVGAERGESRAVAFALGNLATIAMLEHRYAEALSFLERTIELLRCVGDKPRLALFITNLAELRLRLGLGREAEQLLLFGRRVCGISSPRLAQFSLVSARIQLAKGRTRQALADLQQALAPSGLSLSASGELLGSGARGWSGSAGGLVGEALRVATRVALEDGDVVKAGRLIEAASQEQSSSARIASEITLLRALVAQARGEAFEDVAIAAAESARRADDDELRMEATLLCFRATGDGAWLESAVSCCVAIADALPEWLRARFLERPDVVELERERAAKANGGSIASSNPVAFAASERDLESPSSAPVVSTRARSTEAKRCIVGSSTPVRALLHAIRKIGPSDATVLIHGESGTGKELVADAIHDASPRAGQPIVKVNCAALVETLLLSELFGHEKGAFTGAAARRKGRFEAAEGGTLFLDEIGDISHRTQVALLRVLQEKTFERVGGTTQIHANVRIVCASHKDLKALVAAGQFREDLYYRLCGVVLEVPALRARTDDLPAIASALLGRIAAERSTPVKALSDEALEALRQHTWPGNVRELENALRAASLFAEGARIELEDFTSNVESLRFLTAPIGTASSVGVRGGDAGAESARDVAEAAPSSAPGVDPAQATVMSTMGVQNVTAHGALPCPEEVAYATIRSGTSLSELKKQIERECIARAMSETDGNITRAATLLGMKRPRLSQLVKQYGLCAGISGGADGDGDLDSTDEDEV